MEGTSTEMHRNQQNYCTQIVDIATYLSNFFQDLHIQLRETLPTHILHMFANIQQGFFLFQTKRFL